MQFWSSAAIGGASGSASAEYDGSAVHPHDLLWVADLDALSTDAPWPSWASAEWLLSAPVVMRRERTGDAHRLPVGVRGTTRSQRCKAYLGRDAVVRRVTPEMLAVSASWRLQRLDPRPALSALAALAPALDAIGLAWGPTGGAGFALATGLPVLRQDSDLDLLVRAPRPLTDEQKMALLSLRTGGICRIDIQIETGHGGFAVAEWASRHGRVLLKTDDGPRLTDDPWHAESAS
jgi:phosphoribosyl-dephospho-CoA transferase